jgi:hypothetical protein
MNMKNYETVSGFKSRNGFFQKGNIKAAFPKAEVFGKGPVE